MWNNWAVEFIFRNTAPPISVFLKFTLFYAILALCNIVFCLTLALASWLVICAWVMRQLIESALYVDLFFYPWLLSYCDSPVMISCNILFYDCSGICYTAPPRWTYEMLLLVRLTHPSSILQHNNVARLRHLFTPFICCRILAPLERNGVQQPECTLPRPRYWGTSLLNGLPV